MVEDVQFWCFPRQGCASRFCAEFGCPEGFIGDVRHSPLAGTTSRLRLPIRSEQMAEWLETKFLPGLTFIRARAMFGKRTSRKLLQRRARFWSTTVQVWLWPDVIFHFIPNGVKLSPRLMASWIGRGGPVFSTVTSIHNSSPAPRTEGSMACSGRKKATGSMSAVTCAPRLIVRRLT
jgi:hypothetical protein